MPPAASAGRLDMYRRLATLVRVVEAGSISRAARALDLTPSAVSQQMRRLEREARVALFRRTTRRLVLTPAGEALYDGGAAIVRLRRRPKNGWPSCEMRRPAV